MTVMIAKSDFTSTENQRKRSWRTEESSIDC